MIVFKFGGGTTDPFENLRKSKNPLSRKTTYAIVLHSVSGRRLTVST